MTIAAHRLCMTSKRIISRQDRTLAIGYSLLALSVFGGVLRAFTVGPIVDGSLLLTLILFAGGLATVARDSIAYAAANPGFKHEYDEDN